MIRSRPFAWTAWFGAAIAAAILIGPVAILLTARVDDVRDSNMAPPPDSGTLTAVLLEQLPGRQQRVQFRTPDARRLAARQELDVEFATYGKSVPIARGTIAIGGCLFSTPNDARVENNALLRFERSAQCPVEAIGAGPAPVGLTLWVPGGEPLVVWTSISRTAVPDGDFLFVDGSGAQPGQALAGRFVDVRSPSRVRRVHLLNYLWQISGSVWWIALALGAAALLCGAGTIAAYYARLEARRATLRAALAAASITLALGIVYAVVVPPFEAPDEPDHFLSFADLSRRADLTSEAADWARLGHLQRIKFHGDDRFRPADVGQPYAKPWDADIFAVPIGGRSRTTEMIWRGAATFTSGLHAPGTLLTLRLVNVALLAIAIGMGVALVAAQGAGAGALVVSLAFLLVPTLPFFGMHVSESAPLTSTYVFTACVLAALVFDSDRSHRLGLPLGIGIALLFAGGRSAVPMAPVIGAALAGRMLLGTRLSGDPQGRRRQALIFWGGAALGAALLVPASTAEYSRGLWPGDAGHMPVWFRAAAEATRDHAWVLAACLPLGAVLEPLAVAGTDRAGRALRRPRQIVLPIVAYTLTAAVAAVALASLVVAMPALRPFTAATRPPVREYLTTALASIATSVRLRSPDLLISTSFWGAFGWIDTLLPDGLVSALVIVSAVPALWLTLAVARRNDGRRTVWIGVLAAGWLSAIVLNTLAAYFLNRNLHGRYLLGVYLTVLAVAWTAPVVTRLHRGLAPAPSTRLIVLGSIGVASLHAFALIVILRRYF